jgi:hypothetical protein
MRSSWIETREKWQEWGKLVFRVAPSEEVVAEHVRRVSQFAQRFGRPPWGNPDASEANQA